jgi:hypothetical protein
MYVHTSKIVYRAFKQEAFNVEIAKSIHSHLLALWAIDMIAQLRWLWRMSLWLSLHPA